MNLLLFSLEKKWKGWNTIVLSRESCIMVLECRFLDNYRSNEPKNKGFQVFTSKNKSFFVIYAF